MRYHTLNHDCKKHTTLYCATFGMQTVNQVYDMMHRSPKNIIVPSSRYPCLKIGMTSTYRVLTSTYMYLHDLPESQNRRGRGARRKHFRSQHFAITTFMKCLCFPRTGGVPAPSLTWFPAPPLKYLQVLTRVLTCTYKVLTHH